MTEAPYLLYDVFTERALEGNPLAIFPDAAFDDRTMARIARELNLSETVFLTRGGEDVAGSLRIFTPACEVPFAGHPTVGTAIALVNRLGWVDSATRGFVLREVVGDVPIAIDPGPPTVAWLTTPPVTLGAEITAQQAAALLGLEVGDLGDVVPQVASAGNPFLYVALRDTATVDRATFDERAARGIAELANITGAYVFAQTPQGAYARMFAPFSGVPEDPATGSATGPLYAYLAAHGALERRDEFVNEQGVAMGRRSVLRVRLHWGERAPDRIEVGGCAVLVGEGRLHVP